MTSFYEETLQDAMEIKLLEESYPQIASANDISVAQTLTDIYESEVNYNAIMKSLALAELKYYASNKKLLFIESELTDKVKNAWNIFIDKVIAFFEIIKEKIISFWKAVMEKIDDYIRNSKDKNFLYKANTILKEKNLLHKSVEYEGYDFSRMKNIKLDLHSLSIQIDKIVKEINTNGNFFEEDAKYKIINSIFKIPINNNKIADESTLYYYIDEICAKKQEKVTRSYKLADQLTIIGDFVKNKKQITDTIKGFESAYNNWMRYVRSAKIGIKQDEVVLFEKTVRILKFIFNIYQYIFTSYCNGLFSEYHQAKAIITNAIMHNESTNTFINKYNLRSSSIEEISRLNGGI